MTDDLMALPHAEFIAATRAEFNVVLSKHSDFLQCDCGFSCYTDEMFDAHADLHGHHAA